MNNNLTLSKINANKLYCFQDVNDEIPKFRSNEYVGDIVENSQKNTPVTMLNDAIAEVFDFDQGTNGTFNLILEDPSGTFEVN